jgi:hypothetical protein
MMPRSAHTGDAALTIPSGCDRVTISTSDPRSPLLKISTRRIAEGEITVGTLVPVGCVAMATDGHNTLTMLKRREGETPAQLLARLDLAIGVRIGSVWSG